MSDYYEPWTYEYDTLISAPLGEHTPVARPKSLITGQPMQIRWSANWDDDLGGGPELAPKDPIVIKIRDQVGDRVKMEFEQAFMFYLPRICEHCLNPACVAACPIGAMYKRSEDGIVLVDQDACRGWRMCVTGCPYKKVYFNHRTGKAEKCTMCYPRIEVGLPTVCSETCVGRLRYLGIFLYDADRVTAAAATPDEKDLYEAQLDLILDPHDQEVVAAAAARRHPGRLDRRRPPLAGVQAGQGVPGRAAAAPGVPHHADGLVHPAAVAGGRRPARDRPRRRGRRHPVRGPDAACGSRSSTSLSCSPPVTPARCSARWRTLAAMRSYMRDRNLGGEGDESIAESVGLTGDEVYELYRLLAIAKYEDRYVIPKAHAEAGRELEELGCSLDYEGGPGGFSASGPFGEASGRPMPVAVENFHALKARQTAEAYVPTEDAAARVNLLNWDGAVPLGMPGVRRADADEVPS